LGDARDEASKVLQRVERGEDPAAEKSAEKIEKTADRSTVEAVVGDFIEKYAKRRNKGWKGAESMFNRDVIPRWGTKQITEVTRRDVVELLEAVVDRGSPYAANQTLAAVRKLFNWCLERSIVETSPVAGIKAPTKANERDRVLTDDEIKSVWAAFDTLGYPFGTIGKLLLITGQRRDEVASMRWADLDLENKVWTLPREMTKADRSHTVPLSPMAVDILTAVKKLYKTECVFPSRTRKDRHVSGFSKAKDRVDTQSGVKDWRLHDLRRTAASHMARLGTPVNVLSKVLNHASSGAQGGVTAIYNRYGYEPEKRMALEAWSRYLDHLVNGTTLDNVVSINRAETAAT
jgi:integrase